MAWNLVDELTEPDWPRREFYVPLASIPVGQTTVRPINDALYSFAETPFNQRTNDVCLSIFIQNPQGGLVDENGFPDPLVRLHAVSIGHLQFQPASGGMRDRIILEMVKFIFSPIRLPNWVKQWPRWFDRWKEAKCIPLTVTYENVDSAYLQTLLNGISAPVDTKHENSVNPTNGLNFPSNVTQANKGQFIQQFLAGVSNYKIFVHPGAVIGKAAIDPANNTQHLLQLHAYYHDHTQANPHPMNPRELLYLLFGDDSAEANNHPFLTRLNYWGQYNQNNVHPETRRMLLRPPLRTWKRVVWEAHQEIDNHAANWGWGGSLGPNRLHNEHTRLNLSFQRGQYYQNYKCNVFVSDICLRSGFKVCVWGPYNNLFLKYINPNPYANQVHRSNGADERLSLMGRGEDNQQYWGWKIENWLRAQPENERQQRLNEAMNQEGRCFILVGARGRRFETYNVAPNIQGIANCNTAIKPRAGHMIIVREVSGQPILAASIGAGLQRIRVRALNASPNGAVDTLNYDARLGGNANNPGHPFGYVRLHLIELNPGKDPDTSIGLRDLNVRNNPGPLLLNDPNERAPDARITHNENGTPAQPGRCCRDMWPQAVTEIQCP